MGEPTRNDRPRSGSGAGKSDRPEPLAGTELDLSGRHAAAHLDVSGPVGAVRRPVRNAVDDTVPAPDSKPPEEARPPAMPAPRSERYRLGRELGRGGMGRVVEAFDTQLGRSVALKEVLPPKSGVATGTHRRFAREVQLTARLEHPSIVPLYDSGIGPEGRPYYVMRRVEGRPLDELISRARSLDERLTLIPNVLGAIDAVAHAHERGVIHRDIKPQNILVGKLGETVVIDWGLAKVIGEADSLRPDDDAPYEPSPADSLRTQIGSVFGTPGFMAPEQARGEELGTQGDVYALGAVLYQLLGGQPPHAGNSATEVIERTSKHEVKRLDQVAPGVPADLVTIVGKALALESAARYPDAGALADDVRRFLDGQLVAAHSYTKRQRLARFVRRHRAALSVLAVAAVAVAVMAWIGVARIVRERDDAAEARATALEQKAAAEDARDRLADRHDLLVVMQANALLETNPTEALAILKQLPQDSRRIPDARALAAAATVRGVGWALKGPAEFPTQLELDATARFLSHVTVDGMVRVWDLEKRRIVVQRRFGKEPRATWVAGGRLFVTSEAQPPELFDPVANATEKLALPPSRGIAVAATANGDRVVYRTPTGAVAYDVMARTAMPLPYTDAVDGVGIAPDGAWIVLNAMPKRAPPGGPGKGEPRRVIVYDARGVELTRHDGDFVGHIAVSRAKRFAVFEGTRVLECRLDGPAPVWTEVPLDLGPRMFVMWVAYRGEDLGIYVNGELRGWRSRDPDDPAAPKAPATPKPPVPRTWVMGRASLSGLITEVGDDTMMWPTVDGRLHFANELTEGNVVMPISITRAKFAGRAGTNRVVVVGDGVVAGFELDHVLVQRIRAPDGSTPSFVDDETLLVTRQTDSRWAWVDLRTGKATLVQYDPVGMLHGVYDVDDDGRVLLRESSPRGTRIMLMRRGQLKIEMLVDDRDAWARLIPGDAIVFGVGDGRVMARVGDERERELVKLDGVVADVAVAGHLRFAAKSNAGEIVRGDLASSKIERTRMTPARGVISVDGTGRVVVSENKRILAWDTRLEEIATFDRVVIGMAPVDGGLGVTLEGGEARVVDLRAGGAATHRVLPPGKHFPRFAANGKLIANIDAASRVQLVDLPSRARWSLPLLRDSNERVLGVSPSGRRILQATGFTIGVWRLPQIPQLPADFHAWLSEQTNAIVDKDGVLIWPWQQKTP
ncbi:MAG: serine/threonine protein kinase [Deltaproteobacteria bacterium]|nr:serine/threonine protein kinase [Deltaproteobacteria bacterium]